MQADTDNSLLAHPYYETSADSLITNYVIISFVPPQVKDILLYSVIAKNSVITPRLEVATEVSLGVHKKSVATCHNREVVTSLLSTINSSYHRHSRVTHKRLVNPLISSHSLRNVAYFCALF